MERKHHRRVWEKSFGPIPKDEFGRSFEIHHRNKDSKDNRIENLQCVSIQEHFKIHQAQEDWGACAAIARRMGVPVEEQRELNSLAGKSAKERKLGWFDPEHRKRIAALGGEATKGMKWWNNGIESCRAFVCPNGWTAGKLPCGSGMALGTVLGKFWNKDGVNKRSVECPGEGWNPGRYLTEEQRKIRSELTKNQGSTEESKRKQSEKMRGRKLSEEHKKNIKENHWRKKIAGS